MLRRSPFWLVVAGIGALLLLTLYAVTMYTANVPDYHGGPDGFGLAMFKVLLGVFGGLALCVGLIAAAVCLFLKGPKIPYASAFPVEPPAASRPPSSRSRISAYPDGE